MIFYVCSDECMVIFSVNMCLFLCAYVYIYVCQRVDVHTCCVSQSTCEFMRLTVYVCNSINTLIVCEIKRTCTCIHAHTIQLMFV